MQKRLILTGFAFLSIFLMISPTYANDCVWSPSDIYDESFETDILNLMEDYSGRTFY